jgi:dTDP-4-amino-4,6-dideoxygalactose transaminase
VEVPFLDLKSQCQVLKAELAPQFDEVLSSAAFIQGPQVARFEEAFARYCGTKHAIGVANGTDALHLALRALGVGPGDEVITAANTFVATTEAITAAGASVVLVDMDPASYTIDPNQVEAAITPRTRAVIPVHLYGQPAEMDAIMDIARRRGLRVIEDACQAHGAWYKGHRAGSIGDVGCFSFYPGKNLGAYGDAGGVTTNDDEIAARLRLLANHGSKVKYQHEIEGFNSRLDTLQAVVLNAKLARLDAWNDARRARAAQYAAALERSGVTTQRVVNSDHVWHLYVIQTEARDAMIEALKARGIATGIHYPYPVHLTPAYAYLGKGPGSYPHAERAAARILSLPMFPELTGEQADYVAKAIREAVAEVATPEQVPV